MKKILRTSYSHEMVAFTHCILFTCYTREQNTTCKGHLAYVSKGRNSGGGHFQNRRGPKFWVLFHFYVTISNFFPILTFRGCRSRCSPKKCSLPNAPQKTLSKKCSPEKNAPLQNALHQNAPRKKMLPRKKCSSEKIHMSIESTIGKSWE